MFYESIEEIVKAAEDADLRISEAVLRDQAAQMELSEEEVYLQMEENFDVMCESVRKGQAEGLRSTSGLTGPEGFLMALYAKGSGGLSGSFMTGVMARTLAVSCCNASMGKIVAAPTAGSCGILPGCLVSLYEEGKYSKKELVMAAFTAGAVGMVIASRATIAGSEGGCQAECGAAGAMAAAALAELGGGSPRQCADACSIVLACQMGLVCDPVAGLVEIPCIKRNVSGVMNAFAAADMVLAGIPAYIPADEAIDAMGEVGRDMPRQLRETSLGGLAATPTGEKLREKVFGKND
ncbi:MAG: L-serine ammonia-lyase, iron-sulfur-dependent, subunit alpha [Lachnospiraceae bacterium]|nr:L-serine ammonia-lyase, iron-sulfur-dependent, subunit alpha [Lachnospiraceae bacterium]